MKLFVGHGQCPQLLSFRRQYRFDPASDQRVPADPLLLGQGGTASQQLLIQADGDQGGLVLLGAQFRLCPLPPDPFTGIERLEL
jgi:hypothetical protein